MELLVLIGVILLLIASLVIIGLTLRGQVVIMAAIDDLNAAVANETTVEQSVIALLQSLSAQLTAALNGGDTAAIEAVVTQINNNAAAMAAAVTANTPAALVK